MVIVGAPHATTGSVATSVVSMTPSRRQRRAIGSANAQPIRQRNSSREYPFRFFTCVSPASPVSSFTRGGELNSLWVRRPLSTRKSAIIVPPIVGGIECLFKILEGDSERLVSEVLRAAHGITFASPIDRANCQAPGYYGAPSGNDLPSGIALSHIGPMTLNFPIPRRSRGSSYHA